MTEAVGDSGFRLTTELGGSEDRVLDLVDRCDARPFGGGGAKGGGGAGGLKVPPTRCGATLLFRGE